MDCFSVSTFLFPSNDLCGDVKKGKGGKEAQKKNSPLPAFSEYSPHLIALLLRENQQHHAKHKLPFILHTTQHVLCIEVNDIFFMIFLMRIKKMLVYFPTMIKCTE
jgi:hypothetical protein